MASGPDITRRGLFATVAALAMGPKAELPALALPKVTALPVAIAPAAPAVSWVARATEWSEAFTNGWGKFRNWHNGLNISDDMSEEELAQRIGQKLEADFTAILTPWKGLRDLKNSVFTGDPTTDAKTEIPLRKIIEIKKPHYINELQHIADAFPYAEERFLPTDLSALTEEQMAALRNNDLLAVGKNLDFMEDLQKFKHELSTPLGVKQWEFECLGEDIKGYRDYGNKLRACGYATPEFEAASETRARVLRKQVATIAEDAGIDVDLADAITDAYPQQYLEEDWFGCRDFIDFPDDESFFGRLVLQISEDMSCISPLYGDKIFERIVSEQTPGAYLRAFQNIFPDIARENILLPEVSEQVADRWSDGQEARAKLYRGKMYEFKRMMEAEKGQAVEGQPLEMGMRVEAKTFTQAAAVLKHTDASLPADPINMLEKAPTSEAITFEADLGSSLRPEDLLAAKVKVTPGPA